MIGTEGQIYVPVQADVVTTFSMNATGSGSQDTTGIIVHFNLSTGITGVGWNSIKRESNPPKTVEEAHKAILDYFAADKDNSWYFMVPGSAWYNCWERSN